MPRPSLREKILADGFKVVLEQGYCGATVRDIVRAAGVPQGSFTNHFDSKEVFCLELLIRYFVMVQQNITKTLRNDSLKGAAPSSPVVRYSVRLSQASRLSQRVPNRQFQCGS